MSARHTCQPGACVDREHVLCEAHKGLHVEREGCVWPCFAGYPQSVEPALRLEGPAFQDHGYGS